MLLISTLLLRPIRRVVHGGSLLTLLTSSAWLFDRPAIAAPVEAEVRDIRRTDERGVWRVKVGVPPGIAWRPPETEWFDLPNNAGRMRRPLESLDGRRVWPNEDGLVWAELDGAPVTVPEAGALSLSASFATQALCAGPVELAVTGVGPAGEESELHLRAEVYDRRWRWRHCRSMR